MNKTLKFTKYKKIFTKILLKYGIPPDTLVFVNDRNQWLREHNLQIKEQENPNIFATTIHWGKDDLWQIIVKKEISFDDVMLAITTKKTYGFNTIDIFKAIHQGEVNYRQKVFAIFTLLHEIAHRKGVEDELAADKWAYNEVREYLENEEQPNTQSLS